MEKRLIFFNRNTKTDLTPNRMVKRLCKYMPEIYKSHRQYNNCLEFLDQRELELALDCLIELADETGHYFSEEYWIGIADSAEKMNLQEIADYCRQQIARNEKELKSKIPFGWTIDKIDEDLFQTHKSKLVKDQD